MKQNYQNFRKYEIFKIFVSLNNIFIGLTVVSFVNTIFLEFTNPKAHVYLTLKTSPGYEGVRVNGR